MDTYTSMRIRVSSDSDQTNLPQVRSWFHVDEQTTVASLKLSLCASIPALRKAGVHPDELILLLEDFELLDSAAVQILRDGDLVWAEVLSDAPRKRLKGDPAFSSSSSDSSSSTSSDDTSSSGSESSSGSSSDSDSTTSSSSEHPPSAIPRPPPPKKLSHPTNSTISWVCHHRPAPVPPGFGKPETHARNERRRKKRLAGRADNVAPPTSVHSSNAIPLQTSKRTHMPEPMMMSLKNKNKRKGFKSTAGIPSHITFQDDNLAPNLPPTLVPPSERDQLPPRLFVTSVDVEAGMWSMGNKQAWDRKQKKTKRDTYGCEEQAGIPLYGTTPEEEKPAMVLGPDYTALEKAWVNATALANQATPPIGCVVGWQELAINPATLSPEVMLCLARVTSDSAVLAWASSHLLAAT
ncbi:hypothetical protein B0F90DRAFT_1667771 [Multifurca ochricompacta]|uniref:Uncharacterized protein n=1 Tax=Multifurca ochricompacta TaxID=376703 RepID=A0AAD4M6F9_9AGAM|nr:hypothetical protein B0F90DRAFT_1667771 [Multifurca ochricompacta]